ncbi:UDP-glycosyltransferase UGT5-like [Eriocheir sinensis]|uniref:UDP-glycosyltransferase UGT5-like n=1 Tax=Eriocheir sinensis TaxID=95602 RepID=UPI0021C5FDB5|nr:UDP-glycosyltransferase UGT5-like [Eriocheir sinensis]XP_050707400.1 UDP-glycosyltransferase UGT5-like [Eriocheir sinensis]
MRWWVAAVGVAAALQVVGASRILFLAPLSSRSHKNFYMGIINALADRGHQITLLTPYKASRVKENVQEVVLPNMDMANVISNFNVFTGNKVLRPLRFSMEAPNLCADALGDPQTQNLLKEEFDLVILSMFFNDCFLSFVHQLKIPYALAATTGLFGPLVGFGGSITFPSFAQNPLFPFKSPYSFTERITLSLSSVLLDVVFSYVSYRMESVCHQRGLCPEDMPSFSVIRQNSSLALTNAIKTLEVPAEPSVPTTIYCGGIHCHPSNPLPKDLEDWVAGAGEDGFIFFSLGSAVIPSQMPEEHRKTLLQVLGSLKQRVLWKWDKETMDDLPPNVRLSKWLPQQDILGHPKMRLFITHGGLLSTLESMYHGVPVLGIPVFGDQLTNMLMVEKNGWGKVLHWEDLTPETLKAKIFEVMNDESLRKEAQWRSVLMRDQPQRPEDIAVYWVEYVMRHHGAPHLVSPVRSMPWYQLYNVDVWATIIVVLLLLLYVSFRVFKAVCRWLFCGKKKQKHD